MGLYPVRRASSTNILGFSRYHKTAGFKRTKCELRSSIDRKYKFCGAKPELRSKKKRPASLQAASVLVLMGGIEPSTY